MAKFRVRFGSCYRHPRTTQERRINGRRDFLDCDGYQIKVRPCRNATLLVEARDDMIRADRFNRSWKRHRKTQYR